VTACKTHVPSGSFSVSRRQPLVLQAYLGTCVGVALYDEAAGVGGLSHLLLPAPVCAHSTYQPEKYAATGLPLFLSALQKAGASKDRLKAVVAGGALVGPVNYQDLGLDIGGRTADIVKDVLTGEGIAIADAETGGFFTCCLQLDLQTGAATIAPVGLDKAPAHQTVQMPSAKDITRAMTAVQPIPQVALKLLRMAGEENFDVKDLAREVGTDQVISALTLRLCNSAVFSRGKPVDSIQQALIRLGSNHFIKSVVAAAVDGFYRSSESGYSLCKGGLYHHALGTAVVAEAIAGITGRTDGARAYTAGLLHDIGKVVLDRFVSATYPLFYRATRERNEPMRAIEARLFGMDHTQVGEDLARRWAFPQTITQAIRYHHRPEDPAVTHPDLVHVVNLASLLMSRFRCDLELENQRADLLGERLARIGLSAAQLTTLVDAIPMAIFHDTFSIGTPGSTGQPPLSSDGFHGSRRN